VREQKEKGLEVKIGVGRVRVKGIWRAWVDLERKGLNGEKEDRKKKKRRRRRRNSWGNKRRSGRAEFWISQEGEEVGDKFWKRKGVEKGRQRKTLFWNVASIGNTRIRNGGDIY